MDDGFEQLKLDEVASFGKDWTQERTMFYLNPVFKIEKLKDNIKSELINGFDKYKEQRKELFNEGLECQALKFPTKGWQKGKIRCKIIIEFCQDEPEKTGTNQIEANSFDSLDDLRKELNQES